MSKISKKNNKTHIKYDLITIDTVDTDDVIKKKICEML